jgi:hypothetical protein
MTDLLGKGDRDGRRKVNHATLCEVIQREGLSVSTLPVSLHITTYFPQCRAFLARRRGGTLLESWQNVHRRDGGLKMDWTKPLPRRRSMEIESSLEIGCAVGRGHARWAQQEMEAE